MTYLSSAERPLGPARTIDHHGSLGDKARQGQPYLL